MSDQAALHALRNQALAAWLRPSADEARLQAFLAELEPGQREDVETSVRDARTTLRAFVSRPFRGDQDEHLFATAVRAHLSDRFPWLSGTGLRALLDHTDWIF
ncbi:MAG: hypothetical protein H2038_00720 [Brevundimonas sp.]|uniref:hypothetical protein n=1 Tax=Brevundimonas sp. TaxID=1871086 RepID=UPI0017BC36B2|nr:hypothetical protein [Brevundimonas sp.]MBA4803155.1 hypothetical protein [Brevundimonas sp.]